MLTVKEKALAKIQAKSPFWWAAQKTLPQPTILLKSLKQHEIKFHELKNTVQREGKTYHPESSYVIPLEQTKHATDSSVISVNKVALKTVCFMMFPLGHFLTHST